MGWATLIRHILYIYEDNLRAEREQVSDPLLYVILKCTPVIYTSEYDIPPVCLVFL